MKQIPFPCGVHRLPPCFHGKNPVAIAASHYTDKDMSRINAKHVRARHVVERTDKPHLFIYDCYVIAMMPE